MDFGTGNGQAAEELATFFGEVIASDPSVDQLTAAAAMDRVHFVAMTAESCALRARSADLVTVAQALHWFDQPAFYREARRVLVPGGMLAVWTYKLLSFGDSVDELVAEFYHNVVGAYWPAERALVDAGYASIEFPFREVEVPRFEMEATWTLEQFEGYVNTWSAVTRYTKALASNPVPAFIDLLRPQWPAGTTRRITWPLEIRAGTV